MERMKPIRSTAGRLCNGDAMRRHRLVSRNLVREIAHVALEFL
jgi:hypothetical protein